jgi:hypothetical protein
MRMKAGGELMVLAGSGGVVMFGSLVPSFVFGLRRLFLDELNLDYVALVMPPFGRCSIDLQLKLRISPSSCAEWHRLFIVIPLSIFESDQSRVFHIVLGLQGAYPATASTSALRSRAGRATT